MDRAWAEHERKLGRDQRADDRAHPADADTAVRLVGAQQQHQRQLGLADIRHGNEREPVAGRADHELERAMLDERVDQQRGIGAHVGGAEAALEHDLAPVEPADVERERARVDARDARTQTSPFATS